MDIENEGPIVITYFFTKYLFQYPKLELFNFHSIKQIFLSGKDTGSLRVNLYFHHLAQRLVP